MSSLFARTVVPNPKNVIHANESMNLLRTITTMFSIVAGRDPDFPEDMAAQPAGEYSTSKSTKNPDFYASFAGLWAVSHKYQQTVKDCRFLSENDGIFKSIIAKISEGVAEPETWVKFEDTRDGRRASDIVKALLTRTDWQNNKERFVKAMLDEGGLSTEVVVSSLRPNNVDKIIYVPHNSIVPIVDKHGQFVDSNYAYEQRDPESDTFLSHFAAWQIAEANLTEAYRHDRGIPHLQAARLFLNQLNILTKGAVQKYVLESGSIEHINLPEAKDWKDVEVFKDENEAYLQGAPSAMVRQVFTKGKVLIDRIAAEGSGVTSTETHAFFADLVFLAAGVPKQVLGFQAETMIKDMVTIAMNNYYATLRKVQSRLHLVLRKIIILELAMQGIGASNVPFSIMGGQFQPLKTYDLPPEGLVSGAFSLNDVRTSSQLPPEEGNLAELFNTPGVKITPEMALMMAQGVDWRTIDPTILRSTKKEVPSGAS